MRAPEMDAAPLLSPQAAADLLYQAHQTGQPVPPLRGRLAVSDGDGAYQIQELNTRRWLAEGRRLVGRKIGLTSRAVQAQLGVDQPDFGMLFADRAVGDGEPIPPGRLIQPKVEAEVALVLGRDLTHAHHTFADLICATEYVLPALEVVDSRIAGGDIKFLDTVADNASSGLFVLGGQPRRLADVDLAACGMELLAGQEVLSRGNGRACLGHPLNAAVWLANVMARCGRPLRAGDIMLTGALGPMVPVKSGERFDVRIDGLGSVSTVFA